MEKRKSIWDILAWIILAGILIWLILKMFGIINTPILLEFAPYLSAVYLAGWAMHKLETVASDVKELKRFRESTITEINKIKTTCLVNHK